MAPPTEACFANGSAASAGALDLCKAQQSAAVAPYGADSPALYPFKAEKTADDASAVCGNGASALHLSKAQGSLEASGPPLKTTEAASSNGAPALHFSNAQESSACGNGAPALHQSEAQESSNLGTPPIDVFKASCGAAGDAVTEESKPVLWTTALEWTLDFPIATVWDLTRDFAGISKWLPTYMRDSALVEGTPQQPGCVRSVLGYEEHIPAAYDKLLVLDEANHKFKYVILTCHLPLLMGHSPTFHFLEASPTSTILKFSSERPPVPKFDEQSYRAFVRQLYSGFVSDLIKSLSAAA